MLKEGLEEMLKREIQEILLEVYTNTSDKEIKEALETLSRKLEVLGIL